MGRARLEVKNEEQLQWHIHANTMFNGGVLLGGIVAFLAWGSNVYRGTIDATNTWDIWLLPVLCGILALLMRPLAERIRRRKFGIPRPK